MKYILSVFLLFIIYSCKQKQENAKITTIDSVADTPDSVTNIQQPDEFLITDTSFGKINKTTSYTELLNIFGKNNLQDTINYIAEGTDSIIVTKVYSNTPKEIIISWHKFHTAISTIDCYQPNAPYHTADGLKIGSTLESLLKTNGKKITFTGTSWDYGGMISSYHNGKYNNSKIYFRLTSSEDASESIMGDHELNTDMPLVKQNLKKIYISNISLTLRNSR